MPTFTTPDYQWLSDPANGYRFLPDGRIVKQAASVKDPPPPPPPVIHYDPPPPPEPIPEPPPTNRRPDLATKLEWDNVLDVITPGVQRVRLYCSRAVAQTANVFVDKSATVRYVGRMGFPVSETIMFNRGTRARLKYFYDAPAVELVYSSSFWLTSGEEAPLPEYNCTTGEFISPSEITGAMTVSYVPEFSLYEVSYLSGRSLVTTEYFGTMKAAWLSGDVTTASIPPVRVTATSKWHVSTSEFERRFSPKGANAKPEGTQLFTEVPETRVNVPERVFNSVDPNLYSDVLVPQCSTFKNDGTGDVLIFRFAP